MMIIMEVFIDTAAGTIRADIIKTNGAYDNSTWLSGTQIAFSGWSCNTPIHTIEKENTKTMLYQAIGLNPGNTRIEEEFVNKTKDFYINIKGKYEDEFSGYSNELDMRVYIDAEIYDHYSVAFFDGIMVVKLFEIKNEKPNINRI